MSKAHNMPGWRMAMLASNAQFVEWILRVKSNVDSGQFRPMQTAVVEALKAGQEWYDAMNEVYRRRRDVAGRIMNALGCTFAPQQVGMFLWGRILDFRFRNLDFRFQNLDLGGQSLSEVLADKVLHDAKVFITPGCIFGSAGDSYIRLSLCCKEDVLEKALERIKKNIF